MAKFDSVSEKLKDWFEHPLRELPESLKTCVETSLFPLPWDDLSPTQRRIAAAQWDCQHDPATEAEREEYFSLLNEEHQTNQELAHVEGMAANSPLEHEAQTRQLGSLRSRLTTIRTAIRKLESRPPTQLNAGESNTDYIHFLQAKEILATRFHATVEEIAIWVWMGKEADEIDGYREAPHYSNPPLFKFPPFDPGIEYRDELMHCYFKRTDIDSFVPKIRYLTFQQLLARWEANMPRADAIALLKAKCASGDLVGFHPLTGAVSGTGIGRGELGFPPLEDGIFGQNQYEPIEAQCFPDRANRPLVSTIATENECHAWLEALMRSSGQAMAKPEYYALAIDKFHIPKRSFDRAWGKAIASTGTTTWGRKGRKLKRRN